MRVTYYIVLYDTAVWSNSCVIIGGFKGGTGDRIPASLTRYICCVSVPSWHVQGIVKCLCYQCYIIGVTNGEVCIVRLLF